MYDRAPGADPEYRVTHVLNNNAVVVRSESGLSVLVGTGIGFNRKVDDPVDPAIVQQQYVAIEPDKIHYLTLLNGLDPELLAAISEGVELATKTLGHLHPSIYLLLTDHLAFAVERYRDGQLIQNNLLPEIRAFFPSEFEAAELVLHHINTRVGVELPLDEAAFITLHLNAALSGESVKRPLSRANALAGVIDQTLGRLNVGECPRHLREDLSANLVALVGRIEGGRARRFTTPRSIARDLHEEWTHAEWILSTLLGEAPAHSSNTSGALIRGELSPEQRAGETAFLAVFLHGWIYDLSMKFHHPTKE
ncbi:PRD domain-containing protein [Schaalia sp. Marseille-Q2122]|uniref:PRD domain-containing protein n=1 Tax=Schaalia sp. Marseille-Q2122 TaxID=2736604 RepID=UPI00158BF5B9|nr:PRD domain-containing protein [Schaalia sp. Marseille-Q2122]